MNPGYDALYEARCDAIDADQPLCGHEECATAVCEFIYTSNDFDLEAAA
ncbi:hypothetical protein [Nocardia otitidiscaviarum]|nr:hypothetical protein [Nocardia otitidiscaviarum]